jgi:hypothetical protein
MMFLNWQSRLGLLPGVLLFLSYLPQVALAEEIVIEPQPLMLEQIRETTSNIILKASEVISMDILQQRDPFSETPELIQEKFKPTIRKKKQVFTPQTETTKLPKMFLRGHLTGPGGEVVALLQIDDGEVHIVREDDTIGLHDFGVDTVLRIKKISRLHLVVESGSLGQLIIVR